MAKKVLIISQIPTHPQNAGNRVRLFNLCSQLKRMNYELHFLYYDFERYYDHVEERVNLVQMEKFYDRLYVVSNNYSSCIKDFLYFFKRTARKCIPEIFRVFEESRLGKGAMNRIKAMTKRSSYRLETVDDWYNDNPNVSMMLDRVKQKTSFDIVLVNYVILSKALDSFSDNALKLIDTQDIFSEREKIHDGINEQYDWFTMPKKEEAKGLNRADVVIAIKDKDRDYFRKITDKNVVTIGHSVSLVKPEYKSSFKNKLLFVGTAVNPNIYGIRWFLEKVFPLIRAKHPNIEILLAGRVSSVIKAPGCISLNEISDISIAYSAADIVINPVFFGTGLKIKSIEALGYGKPLMTSPHGAEGLEDGIGKVFFVFEKPEDFAKAIVDLYNDKDNFNTMSKKAYDYAVKYNENILSTFQRVVNSNQKGHINNKKST